MLEYLQTLLLAIIAVALVLRVWHESKRVDSLRIEIGEYLELHAAKIAAENDARFRTILDSLGEAAPAGAYFWLTDEGGVGDDGNESTDNIEVD